MPPKKLKKPPRNPFYFFMMDWKKEQISKGHSVPMALNLLAEAATPDWKNVSEEKKKYYQEKARIAKDEDKTNLHNKFTTDGKSFAQVYAEEKEVSDFNQMMYKEITDTITSISNNRKSLISHRFYLIHANHYCYWHSNSVYIPCEIAVAEYSIAEGVSDTVHFFPVVLTEKGNLPMGYLHEAQEIAKRTHCVPLPPSDLAEDYDTIAARLSSFLQRSGSSELPPLYTQENNISCNNSMSTVKDFLNNCEQHCDATFRAYNLPQLFFELRNACADLSVREGIDPDASEFPTVSLAQMELDRDIFHYSKGISCSYHEELNYEDSANHVVQYCSLSTVQRWCFLISDYCCKDVGVPLEPGKHCPPDTQLAMLQATNGSSSSNATGGSNKSDNNKKKKPVFVDDPAPTENCWGKGPPKVKEAAKLPPTGVASSTTKGEGESFADSEAFGGNADNSLDDFPSLDGLRLPKTRGRGERLLAAINRVKLDAKEDFPALGVGRGRGRF